jgi:hypothetical protein
MRSSAVISVPADVEAVEETARIDSGATVLSAFELVDSARQIAADIFSLSLITDALKNLDLHPGETVLIDGVG